MTAERQDDQALSAREKALMVHAMMLCCHIDGVMNPEERAVLKSYARSLPEFKGEDFQALFDEAKRIASAQGTVEAAVGQLEGIRGERARRKTYLYVVELAMAAGEVVASEERLLASVQLALGIDAAVAARIREVMALKYL